jgi:hypothetical protein
MFSRRPNPRFNRGRIATVAGSAAPPATGVTELISLSSEIYASGYGDSIANTSILRRSNPVTQLTDANNGTQFMAWHKQLPKTIVLAKRTLTAGTWGAWTVVETGITPTTADDSHNFLSLMPDSDGDVLVAGDMHGVEINWQRIVGGDLTGFAWAAAPIEVGATDEASVTYPMFVRLPTGDVLFLYRDGASGDGKLVLKKWNRATNTLTFVAVLVDGNIDSQSFYPHVPHYDEARGRLHIMGCWRRTTAVSTNHDQIHFYLTSADGWASVSALKMDGTSQTLPVTIANAAYAKVIAENVGLTNVGSIVINSQGYPRGFTYRDPGDGFSQVYMLAWNGSSWDEYYVPGNVLEQNAIPFSVVDIGSTVDYTAFSMYRAVCDGTTDRIIVLGRTDSEGSGVWAYISEGDLTEWTRKQIDATNVGFWFACEDDQIWKQRGEIHMFHQRCGFPAEGSIGAQSVKLLEFRPQSAEYTYTAPTALFDASGYGTLVADLAPMVGGQRARGTVDADQYKITATLNRLNAEVMCTPPALSDALTYDWDYFGSRRAGMIGTSVGVDFMYGAPATFLAAVNGAATNVPFVWIGVLRVTANPGAGARYWSICQSTTSYMAVGTTAAGLPTFERRVGGASVKQYTGSAGNMPTGSDIVVTAVFNGSTGYMRVNGVQQGAAVDMTFGTISAWTVYSENCRRRSSNDLLSDAVHGRRFIFAGTIPDASGISAIESGLASEYGITF